MLELAVAIGIGLVLGVATGIPLGVVNLAVVEAATRVSTRQATAIGIGGALADGVHASLAFAGIAPLLNRYPEVRRAMLLLCVVVVVAYAVMVWRRGNRPRPASGRDAPRPLWRAVGLGASLTLPNPVALASWVAVAAAVPHGSLAVGLAAAGGVAVGSAGWFTVLARLAGRHALDGTGARRLARGFSVILIVLVAVAVIRELG